jgi:hypothetical protein
VNTIAAVKMSIVLLKRVLPKTTAQLLWLRIPWFRQFVTIATSTITEGVEAISVHQA